MRYKWCVANYMFRSQEHSFICQPPRGAGKYNSDSHLPARWEKGIEAVGSLLQANRGGRTQSTMWWAGCCWGRRTQGTPWEGSLAGKKRKANSSNLSVELSSRRQPGPSWVFVAAAVAGWGKRTGRQWCGYLVYLGFQCESAAQRRLAMSFLHKQHSKYFLPRESWPKTICSNLREFCLLFWPLNSISSWGKTLLLLTQAPSHLHKTNLLMKQRVFPCGKETASAAWKYNHVMLAL